MTTPRTQFFKAPAGTLISTEDKKSINDTQRQVGEWIAKHRKDYISHAIWENNVKGVLTDGALSSAEAQLRKNGSVSYEAGSTYSDRATKNISHILADLKETHKTLPKRITLETKITFKEAKDFNFIDEAQYQKFFIENKDKALKNEPITIKLKDGKDYPVTYHKIKHEYYLGDALSIFPWINDEFQEISKKKPVDYRGCTITYLGELPYKFSCNEEAIIYDEINDVPCLKKHSSGVISGVDCKYGIYLAMLKQYDDGLDGGIGFQVASDMISETPVDKYLALVWEKYKELQISSDYRKLAVNLLQFRDSYAISSKKLNAELRAGYNGIWWHYGDVVVLSGDTEKFMSVISKGSYKSDLQKPLEEVKLENGQEVSLREPFENGGQFFSWDLAQEDTIVIGPKKTLEQYLEIAKSKGIKLFYIEDMNQEQLNFFKVPTRLQPTKTVEAVLKVENPSIGASLKSLSL